MKQFYIIISIFWFSICFNTAYAAHIVGGTITYECAGLSLDSSEVTFDFTCTLYRDVFGNGAPFDNPADFGVYIQSGNGWEFFSSLPNINLGAEEMVNPVDDPCVDEPTNSVAVESGTYNFQVTLPVTNRSYMVGYPRCCRNGTINNISDPGGTGIALTVRISPEAQISCNNSPSWNNFPPIFICEGIDLSIDHTAVDAEGDSIVYRFCAPLTAGTDGNGGGGGGCAGPTPDPATCLPPYDEVSFIAPLYSPQFPMNGSPLVNIGLMDGIIRGVPNILGQFCVGVCAEEYRDGIRIGEIRRDFQFNVLECTPLVFADIEATANISQSNFFIQSCGSNTVFFENLSTQESSIATYEWVFDINGVFDTITTRDATFEFPGIGQYSGTMILNKGLGCSDTAYFNVGVYPDIDADFEFKYDTCVAGPVSFTDLSVTGAQDFTSWEWDFGEGDAETQNTSFLFSLPGNKIARLIVTDDNECKDTMVKIVEYYPVPTSLVVEPNAFVGCAPANITFDNLSSPFDSTFNILWTFGDGTSSTDYSPVHEFQVPGTYSISLKIISAFGCETIAEYPNWIEVKDGPEASFYFTPEELNSYDKTVQFFDESFDAVSRQWSFGSAGFSQLQSPIITFQDTGQYSIQLVAFHESGCTDTLIQTLDVEPLNSYFFPNAFTPNFDGKNETFKGKGRIDGLQKYEMLIWNRWGEVVFKTNDPENGWDGRKNNQGDYLPNGVYLYTYSFTGARNVINKGKGKVTLIN